MKRKSDGYILISLARLVARGTSPNGWGGIDYEERFAPVEKFTSIRIVAAMVAHLAGF